MSTTDSTLRAWVADYAANASNEDSVEEFVGYLDQGILAAIPALSTDPVLTKELHASTRAQFRAFLNLLDQPEQDVLLPPQAIDLALSIARRGLELGILLKVYRVANSLVGEFFSHVVESIPDDGPDRTAILKHLWGRGGQWTNDAVEQLITVYINEREAALHGTLARRGETVRAVLRGDSISIDVASRDLGHHLRAHQTGMVLWIDGSSPDDTGSSLDAVAQALAASAQAPRPLTLPAGRRELWFWVGTRTAPHLGALAEVMAAQSERVPGIRLAHGRPVPGVDGFRSSHREALEAQRCALMSAAQAVVTTYDEVELVCLISNNPDGAESLVARELADLAGSDPALARVRETLGRYLRHGGNVEQTAKDLLVHKNTIRYRLAQAEELIGHPLTERRTEIDLALRYLDR
ncbi:MAG: helix-turn-helix domain-containing protein [Nocardioidaceae bacterium]|nr:helix-turn-helix domain-containing protein [Nocardioidaceae bacterium]